ncbi:sporangia induced conserved hypothetical protein [Phytophthora infestans T30-4]|uniref:Alpha/beta hydrolase fold-3 domain-containing protein n=1 Tax=Phytophthora infestans (strain T30-4) TaxID=403677 RepID=D0NNW8_PHYIT|nr:sporangia induced conserved hypothetical protein [Phytophthora infestans T30-4]EEY62289.1 sporangia induced conserved hypothetical protein [Phytophthora infestans T30-4]|eukprot:XP_002899320.1 sporangia induced conserved hypothetical protein [Phytophthora infestans T30-4]
MVALTEPKKLRAQWAILRRIWADPERRRLIVRLLFGGATGALTVAILNETFKGMCSTPLEAVRLMVRLVIIVGSTTVWFVARGCKPKFKNWTLSFEILRAVIRECTRAPHGERMVMHAKHACVIRSQSAAFGTALGWLACRQHGRRLEPVHTNGLEHIWLRSTAPSTPTTKRLVVLYVHGGGFAVMSPRLYVSFGATLAVAIEKELRLQLGTNESVRVDVFLGNYLSTASLRHLKIPSLRTNTCFIQKVETFGDSEAKSAHCILSPEMIAAGRRGYHTTATDRATWADASSVHCDLRDLPPVFVQAASLDYIYQHSIGLAKKAEADGVTNWELDVHEDLPHVFAIFPSYVLPYAQIGVQRAAVFAAKHFAKASSGDDTTKEDVVATVA